MWCGLHTEEALSTLWQHVIDVTVPEKFAEIEQQGLSSICLFPIRKACDKLNSQMLGCLISLHEIACVDEVNERAGTHK